MRFFKALFVHALLLFLVLNSQLSAQIIDWEHSFGGSSIEKAQAVQQTTDGGYIVLGYTLSNDGDVLGAGYHGGSGGDYWVVKLDSAGLIVWKKCFGGTLSDIGQAIQQTSDGGYILMGYELSIDGDVTNNHGAEDFWLVKLDSAGNLVWEKALGSPNTDLGYAVRQTSDGGYIVAGEVSSAYGNVNPINFHGAADAWVVKLDSTGNITWEKCYGGSGTDSAESIIQTSDGGYIFAGRTASNDGDVTGNHGGEDLWVVKISATGSLTWQKCFGGSANDGAYDIKQTSDGGYIVAGRTQSNNSGNVGVNHGSFDAWLIKITSTGTLTWQNNYGGYSYEEINSVLQTSDGGYISVGRTSSNDGDVTGNHGQSDIWVIRTDSAGNLLWQKCLGGTMAEEGYAIQQTSDGMYIIAGSSNSNDGDVTGNHGSTDFWIVKLSEAPIFTPPTATSSSPIPFTITAPATSTIHYTNNGTIPTCTTGTTGTSPINLTTPGTPGTYIYKAISCQTGSITPAISTGTYTVTGTLAAPIFTPPSGTSTSPISFTITADPTATIHYTDDGTTATCASPLFGTSPISLTTPGIPATYVYNAIACETGYTPSTVSTGTYTITTTPTLSAPIFTPPSGTSTSPISFTITADPTATIHYTNDSSTPDCSSPLYGTSPIYLTTPGTPGTYVYKAIACETGYTPSTVSTGTYNITNMPTLSMPVFTPPTETSTSPISFTITADPAATIHYTDDGTAPTCLSPLAGTSPIYLTTPAAIGTYKYMAIACGDGYNPSEISTGVYIIEPVGINECGSSTCKLNVYPNPTSGFINISTENISNGSLVVYNHVGQIVFTKILNNDTTSLDLYNYAKGVYYFKLSGVNTNTQEAFSKTEKIVLE